jgi:hypothetical protein
MKYETNPPGSLVSSFRFHPSVFACMRLFHQLV